jgi:antitoxin component YwqK of YwqJK toxin-antitoxin module
MSRFHFILLLFFFTIHTVSGQDTLNRKDAQGRKQGHWIKYDSAGNKAYEGLFKDGVPIGEFRYFFPNGRMRSVTLYSDNGKRATTVSYFPNGMKMAEGRYVKEKKDSIWLFYNQADGSLALEETYRNGVRNGVSRTYYPGGGISGILYWKDGFKDGLWEEYYSNGSIKLHGTFNMNDKEGSYRAFYEAGTPLVIGQYANGHQDGIWTYFDSDGAVSRKETWDKGTLVVPKK